MAANETAHMRRIRRQVYNEETHCWICLLPATALKYPHPAARSLDHITPRSKGGRDTRDNLHLACASCNRYRNKHRNKIPTTEPIFGPTCSECGRPTRADTPPPFPQAAVIGHIKPPWTHPELTTTPSNLVLLHYACRTYQTSKQPPPGTQSRPSVDWYAGPSEEL